MTGVRFPLPVVVDASLAWFESLGYAVKHGREIPGKLRSDGDDRARAPVRAKNALVQTLGNMQKLHFALRHPSDRLI
jgi:hypothetical protein